MMDSTMEQKQFLNHVSCTGVPVALGRRASNASLSGTLPSNLGTLLALKELNLPYNALSGSIPVQLSGILNLETL